MKNCNAGRAKTYRIATMDSSAEEAEIRRALEPVQGIRGLSFQLSTRTLAIEASEAALPSALLALRKIGFDPQELPHQEGAASDLEHSFPSGVPRLVIALVPALGAEMLAFFAPDTRVWQAAGMAIAAIGIWLAGLETYTKGFSALRHARLNINALMSVAVTGAFLIGHWAEAAMVMALYALAELLEARAV